MSQTPTTDDPHPISAENDSDAVSYELPVDEITYGVNESIYKGSTNGLSVIPPPAFNNQSTPKKPCFTTKVEFYLDSY